MQSERLSAPRRPERRLPVGDVLGDPLVAGPAAGGARSFSMIEVARSIGGMLCPDRVGLAAQFQQVRGHVEILGEVVGECPTVPSTNDETEVGQAWQQA
jgi:hypothetical protein